MNKFIKKIMDRKFLFLSILYFVITLIVLVWALIVGEIKWSEWYQVLLIGLLFSSVVLLISTIFLVIYYMRVYGKFWEFDNMDEAKIYYSKKKNLKRELRKLERTNKQKQRIDNLEKHIKNLSDEKNN